MIKFCPLASGSSGNSIFAGTENTRILIDAGVSGSAAEKIALKLYQVSKGRQVICVTHLARIAAQADRHMKIMKSVEDSKTYTSVTVLDFEQRAAEVARITAGDAVTALQLETAKEMLINAAQKGDNQ